MRYQAVIFDLFGTLVDNPSYLKGTDAGAGWDSMMESVAATLGIGLEAFQAAWSATEDERYTGSFPTMQAYLEHVCHRAGVSPKPDGISQAVAIRLEYFMGVAIPRVDTIATLVRLKDSGHKIGLISDCVLEDSLNWPHTPMAPLVDAAVLSCEVGLRKPRPSNLPDGVRASESHTDGLSVRGRRRQRGVDRGFAGRHGCGLDSSAIRHQKRRPRRLGWSQNIHSRRGAGPGGC